MWDPPSKIIDRPAPSPLLSHPDLPVQVDRPARGASETKITSPTQVDRLAGRAKKKAKNIPRPPNPPPKARLKRTRQWGGGVERIQQIAATFRCGLTLSSS